MDPNIEVCKWNHNLNIEKLSVFDTVDIRYVDDHDEIVYYDYDYLNRKNYTKKVIVIPWEYC